MKLFVSLRAVTFTCVFAIMQTMLIILQGGNRGRLALAVRDTGRAKLYLRKITPGSVSIAKERLVSTGMVGPVTQLNVLCRVQRKSRCTD